MPNPWTKKNPFMSAWLSSANAFLGAARGHSAAAAKRQASTLTTQITKDMLSFWAPMLGAPSTSAKKRRKRR